MSAPARADVTVLWSEVRGLASAAARLEPEVVLEQLNAWLESMAAAIRANDGTLDIVRGTTISATFGAFDDPSDHATRACAAASDMLVRLESRNIERASLGLPALDLGIGVATGRAVVGEIGPVGHRRPGVIGEPATLAAQLEGASMRLRTPVVLARTTASRLDADQVHSLGWAEIRGIAEPVQVATLAWLAGASDAD
jgi:adenylate cyclase